jgi:hypothetical protein
MDAARRCGEAADNRVWGMANLKLISAVAGALGVAQFAGAAAMYTTNFDAMTPGSINGQEGWLATNPSFNQSVTAAGPGVGGTQAWLRANTFTSGSFSDQPYSAALPAGEGAGDGTGLGSQNNRVTTYSVQFKPVAGTPDNSSVSLSASDQGGGARMNYARLDYNGATGVNIYVDDATSNGFGNPATFNEYQIASNLDPTQYHTLTVSTIFNPGGSDDIVVYSIDGTNAAVIGSWESYYKNDPELVFSGNQTTAVDSVLFRTGGAAQGAAAGFFFDNFSLTAVPEPASLSIVALGGLLLARRPRKESATA